MTESINERLKYDYHEMMMIQNRPYLSWTVTKGEPPYAREYLLTADLRTYALTAQPNSYTVGTLRRCIIKVTLWDSYPRVAPNIRMLNIPPVFHPDWYSKGTYSPSVRWSRDESLKDYIKRMLGSLIYQPSLISSDAPANYKALDWYLKHRGNGSLFPSDLTELTENSPEEAAALEKAAADFDEIVDSWSFR